MRVKVDRDLCAGCGECADACPDVFEMDDEDKATVKLNPVPPDLEDASREAALQCPTDAIEIEE